MMVASVTVALQASSAPLLLWAGPARARLWGLWVWCLLQEPKRTIPMGIIVTCVVVSVVYGLMSYVAAGVLPYEQIAGQNLSVTASASMPNHALFAFFVIGGGVCADHLFVFKQFWP